MNEYKKMELVAPAGTFASLKAAVTNGADAVYCGFADETNARNFPGLNFTPEELAEAVAFAHDYGAKVYVAINTYPKAGQLHYWQQAVGHAATAGVDAVILADIGFAAWVGQNYPGLRRHLSVQASASCAEAIRFCHKVAGIERVVLPRVLSVDEIAEVIADIPVQTEVFGFGGLCVMAEGRCCLSSYVTGVSPNRQGACSPATHVQYEDQDGWLTSKLGGFVINRFEDRETASYPTLCKGRYLVEERPRYLFEEPTSLDVTRLLPDLAKAGVTAIKIEGRQRGRAYIAQVVRAFRMAIDAAAQGRTVPAAQLASVMEGKSSTEGAYNKSWR